MFLLTLPALAYQLLQYTVLRLGSGAHRGFEYQLKTFKVGITSFGSAVLTPFFT